MSWIQTLYTTYEACKAAVGNSTEDQLRPLLPICHITAQAHIEVVLNKDGCFRRAKVVNKTESITILPCTEGSASRSGSKPENHPLCDKLQYLAGDFVDYGGKVTSGFSEDPKEPYENYVKTLTSWCESGYAHPKAIAVLKYVKKKTLIKDLVKEGILFVGEDKKFLSKENVSRDKDTKDIFSVVDPQENALVRWVVENPEEKESRTWRDRSLWESWKKYYLESRSEKDLCLITGEEQIITNNHPRYIRREGDGAKLISSNDTAGFTFRGRFVTDKQACSIGLESSQKAHFALMWLISRQGYRKGDLAVVAWAVSGNLLPQPTDSALELLIGDLQEEEDLIDYTAQELGIKLSKRIAGYGARLDKADKAAVIALDSATQGRLAIVYYRDLAGSDFLEKLDYWHTSCAWLHRYGEIQDPRTGKPKRNFKFYGAPSPADIAEAAYGPRVDDKLLKTTITRLLPCIIDGQPLPRDLVESAIRRASNRVALDEWHWEKTLSIACALYRKFVEKKEKFTMALDETKRSRDYLYGRLLAIADVLEERELYKGDKGRATNATRYMQQFSQRPYRTWKQIHDLLSPYFVRLGEKAYFYKNLIAEIESLFDPADFTNNKPLSGEYLLGYYCQRQKMTEKKTSGEEEPVAEAEA